MMSQDAIWIPLSIDWYRSEMFDEATPDTRLAWVMLLCYIKQTGRAGKAKVRAERFAEECRLSVREVLAMLKTAREDGAIEIDGDVVTLCNWKIYNDKTRKR